MCIQLDPPPCILGIFICEKFQVAALLLLILTLMEPPNTWKSEYLFLGRSTVYRYIDLFLGRYRYI